MPIDDPIDAARRAAESDERAQLFPMPEPAKALMKVFGRLSPVAEKLGSMLISRQEKLRQENHELLLQVTADEASRLSGKIENLEAKVEQWENKESLYNLLMEAAAQSEDVTDAERVKRIAKIFARAIVVGPATQSDRAVELMRIARMLTDQDVEALRQMYQAQFKLLGPNTVTDIDAVNDAWRSSKPKIPGVLESDLLDILLKLQGQGLVRIVERRDTKLSPNEQPFALSNKGADFVRYALGFTE